MEVNTAVNNSPEEKELAGVSVIFHNITERIREWTDAIIHAGGTVYEEGNDEVIAAAEHITLKVAVIIGNTDESHLEKIIQEHEQYFADPLITVVYFLFVRKGEEPKFSHDRIKILYYADIAPKETPKMINSVLSADRLPPFLRTGYDVEICENLLEIDAIKYRKVIVRSYTGGEKKELNYETNSLYIHNRELHELKEGVMKKVGESSDIDVTKGSFTGHVTLIMLKEKK